MRKTKEITVNDRGVEKTFTITEMSATEVEMWIITALAVLAKGKSQSQVIDDIESAFENPMLILALLDGIEEDKVKRLLDKLYSCVKFEGVTVSANTIDGIVSSVASIIQIKKAVLEDLLSFFEELRPMFSNTTPNNKNSQQTQATTINMRTSEQA